MTTAGGPRLSGKTDGGEVGRGSQGRGRNPEKRWANRLVADEGSPVEPKRCSEGSYKSVLGHAILPRPKGRGGQSL